ncbi:MAG: hypothetical protein ACLRP8_05590 [Roseburia intestinalis]
MRNKKILQKAAKKSLSWLLILGMLVTLPETPGAISAAAAELETGTEETVHEESSDADRMEETKNAVTEKPGNRDESRYRGTRRNWYKSESGNERAGNRDPRCRSRERRCRNRGCGKQQ